MLAGRDTERQLLRDAVRTAVRGEAAVLQLVGDAGIGKTSLLGELTDAQTGTQRARVLHATAVRSEMELPFAGLHSLIASVQELLPGLPVDQRRALSVALGISSGDAGGDLLLGAAFLQLLGLVSESSPVLVVVDDLQWLDNPSRRCVSFAARRLGPERVAMVLASRPGYQLDGIATVTLKGLSGTEATALLSEVHPDLVTEVQHELIAQTSGNPLSLLEHAGVLTAPQRHGLDPIPSFTPASQRLHEYFAAKAATCPAATRQMLLLVALEGSGELAVLAEAGSLLHVTVSDLEPAEQMGLIAIAGSTARIRDALVAQAVLQLAEPERIRAAHRALAAALGDDDDAGVLHAAAACTEPDAAVADRLEAIAVRGARSGAGSATAAFARAAALSADSAQRTRCLSSAAESALAAGMTERALHFLDALDARQLSPRQRTRAAWTRGRVELESGHPQRAAPLLVEGSADRRPADRAAALAEVIRACIDVGDAGFARLLLGRAEALLSDIGAEDLDGLRAVELHLSRARAAVLAAGGDTAGGTALLRPSLESFTEYPPGEDRVLWLALGEALSDSGDLIAARRAFLAAAGIARLTGDVPGLADALGGQAFTEDMLGQWTAAYATGTEALEFVRGWAPLRLDILLVLAQIDAARGDETRCRERCAQIRLLGAQTNAPASVVLAERREALLDLGLDRLPAALDRLHLAQSTSRAAGLRHPILSSVPDLVEIHVRAGMQAEAAALVPEFAAIVTDGSPPSARARLLRTQALVADSDAYPSLFAKSVALDEHTGLSFLRARTLLCWGERLRRDRRRTEARSKLQQAHSLFDALEAVPWSARSAAELAATGAPAPVSTSPVSLTGRLTAQELQIAVLTAEGRRNRDIASTLFLSVRTVEFHLTNVYRKVGVSSRSQLAAHVLRGSTTPSSAA